MYIFWSHFVFESPLSREICRVISLELLFDLSYSVTHSPNSHSPGVTRVVVCVCSTRPGTRKKPLKMVQLPYNTHILLARWMVLVAVQGLKWVFLPCSQQWMDGS